VRLSATDFPDHLSAVVFCQGCAWRCTYCHNPHLLPSRGEHEIDWTGVLAFLGTRRGLLDAVVFSGGEPTAQSALARAIGQTRALGFKIGLHTAGMHPRRLADVLPLVDWVGMDVKAPFDDYERITHARGSGERARSSARTLIASGVRHEFRTTVDAALLSPRDVSRIAEDLAALGAKHYVLQECRDVDGMFTADSTTHGTYFAADVLAGIAGRFQRFETRIA
jgi:pyruvate formate lyase activating enzyme